MVDTDSADRGADMQRSAQVHEYPVVIREIHLDTFGHVNNAVYLQLFEDARWDIITARGYGLERVRETQIGPTLLDIHMQFKLELRLRERVTIKSQVTSRSRKTMTMRQTIIKESGEEACITDVVLGLFDLRTRRLVEPTNEWLHAIGAQ